MTVMTDHHTIHTAIYRWKPNAPIAEIESALDDLQHITEDIPDIQLFSWGRNTSKYSEGFSHAIVIVAKNSEAIDAYRQHSIHQPVAKLLDEWEETGVGVDFEK